MQKEWPIFIFHIEKCLTSNPRVTVQREIKRNKIIKNFIQKEHLTFELEKE